MVYTRSYKLKKAVVSEFLTLKKFHPGMSDGLDSPSLAMSGMMGTLGNTIDCLKDLGNLAAAHGAKFEFVVSHVCRFFGDVSENGSREDMTVQQIDGNRLLKLELDGLRVLMSEYQKQCWATPTIQNSTSYVPTALHEICGKLEQAARMIDPKYAHVFERGSQQWIRCHLRDLAKIAASFNQYLRSGNMEPDVAILMEKRLASIDDFREKYESNITTPGLMLFSPIPVRFQGWKIDHTDLEMDANAAGSGASAEVFCGKDKRTGSEVAIKKMKTLYMTSSSLQTFQREVAVLATVKHPSLVGFVGATDTAPFCIVTEWVPCGTLFHNFRKLEKLDATMRTIAAFDIARGMQYLHSKRIIHRDLKSLNVLLDKNGYIRICDFGCSRGVPGDESICSCGVGTPHWMAPELMEGNESDSPKVDVYAFGILLWEIVSLKEPFAGMETHQIIYQVVTCNNRPDVSQAVNQEMRDLICRCWERDPERRPSFDEIVDIFAINGVTVDGANVDHVREHIRKSLDPLQTERFDISLYLHSDGFTDGGVDKLIEKVHAGDVPGPMMSPIWDSIQKHLCDIDIEIVTRLVCVFLNTAANAKAAAFIRAMPHCSIPRACMISMTECIPTGSEEVDLAIVITACKNDAADAAIVYSTERSHLQISMEIASQSRVALSLHTAVSDKCIQCCGSDDIPTICAAVRCLVAIENSGIIPLRAVKRLMLSPSLSIQSCGFAAAIAIAMSDVNLPADLIDVCVGNITHNLAPLFILSACKSRHNAPIIVTRISCDESFDIELRFKVLLASAIHVEARPSVRLALSDINCDSFRDHFGRTVVNRLLSFVSS